MNRRTANIFHSGRSASSVTRRGHCDMLALCVDGEECGCERCVADMGMISTAVILTAFGLFYF